MRLALFLTTALVLPLPLAAETLVAGSRVTQVTIYPYGATVVRQVALTAPAGEHLLVVPDLPAGTDPATLRVVAPEGVTLGAVTLAEDRLLPTDLPPAPAVAEAQAEVDRLAAVIRDKETAIAAINLRVAAAEDQLAVLRGLGQARAETVAAADLAALVALVGEQALAAGQAALTARTEAEAAQRALEPDRKALADAQARLDALVQADADHAALSLTITTDGAPATLTIETQTEDASWQPAYDLRLTRGAEPALVLSQGATVSQASGEDWVGVALILSTARPADRTAPPALWPDLRRIHRPEEDTADARMYDLAEAEPLVGAPAPMAGAAALEMVGFTATYRAAGPVDIRDGVEALRVPLGDVALRPTVRALAVPRLESVAYLMAGFTNDSGAPILPGPAMLYADGALVGAADLPLIAAGTKAEVGFGAIDGLTLTRTIPDRTEGDSGILSKSNEITETAILTVENRTSEDWPIRVLDQVPYSEQEDLVITHSATPPATETDVEGQRGVLAWDMALSAGQSAEIRLETRMKWPEDMALE